MDRNTPIPDAQLCFSLNKVVILVGICMRMTANFSARILGQKLCKLKLLCSPRSDSPQLKVDSFPGSLIFLQIENICIPKSTSHFLGCSDRRPLLDTFHSTGRYKSPGNPEQNEAHGEFSRIYHFMQIMYFIFEIRCDSFIIIF